MSDIRLSVVITLHKDLELIDQPAVFSPDHIHALVFLGCSRFPDVPDLSFLGPPIPDGSRFPFGAIFGLNKPMALIVYSCTLHFTLGGTVRAPELDPL